MKVTFIRRMSSMSSRNCIEITIPKTMLIILHVIDFANDLDLVSFIKIGGFYSLIGYGLKNQYKIYFFRGLMQFDSRMLAGL